MNINSLYSITWWYHWIHRSENLSGQNTYDNNNVQENSNISQQNLICQENISFMLKETGLKDLNQCMYVNLNIFKWVKL